MQRNGLAVSLPAMLLLAVAAGAQSQDGAYQAPRTPGRRSGSERHLANDEQRPLGPRRSQRATHPGAGVRRLRSDSGRAERGRERQHSVPGRGARAAQREPGGLVEPRPDSEVLHTRHSARQLHAAAVPDRADAEGGLLCLRMGRQQPRGPPGPARRQGGTAVPGWATRWAASRATPWSSRSPTRWPTPGSTPRATSTARSSGL